MEYRLCDDTWNEKELEALQAVIDSRMFSMGEKTKEFEKEFAEKFDVKYAAMVSSGSAANLLLIASLVYSGRIKKGDEVIVPAVSWSTTFFPLCQFGLKIKFVDIDKDTLNISVDKLRSAISEKTKMIFLVNLLGNPNEFDEIFDLCDKENIIIIEDNCESLGGKYKGKYLGTLGLAGTFSTFYSHHLCTMEGGVVVTNDEELYHYMLAIRAHGWTRNLPKDSPIYQKNEDDFYESFNFIVPGFNLRPLEMEAAVGIEQLKKQDCIIEQRIQNGEYFRDKMSSISGIRIQRIIETSSYFGFAVILNCDCMTKRDKIIKDLKKANIEVRPIVAGNFTRNKAIKYMDYEIAGTLENADDIHDNGFFIGNHCKNSFIEIDYFVETLKKSLEI